MYYSRSCAGILLIDNFLLLGQNKPVVNEGKPRLRGGLDRFVPVILLITVALAFLVGVLWQKVTTLEKGGVATGTNQAAGPAGDTTAPDFGKLTEEQAKNVKPVSDSDHIKGDKNAKVLLIEYSDLECPFCQQFHPTIQKVAEEFGNDVAWVYRHYPLVSIHPRALPAANASECVANLGGNDAFWKFVDTVFSDQTTYLQDDGLAEAAELAGVGKSDFQTCYADNKFSDIVDADTQSGNDAGVSGTPATFIMNQNGDVWLIPGAYDFDTVKSTVEEALN